MTGPAERPVVTALYVPGDRPDRFAKAVATGADLVILDLEDAVAPRAKAAARDAVVEWLTAGAVSDASSGSDADAGARAGAPVYQVRVNAGEEADLRALEAVPAGRFELRLPKVESAADVDRVVLALPGVPVTALIESALGVERAFEIASHPAVTRLGLGESDLASELGTRSAEVVDHVRIRLLLAAKAAGLPAPLLSAYPGIGDDEGLRADTVRGRDLGWFGRAAIHPSQLAVIARVFAPREEEVEWARAVLTALADSSGAATRLPGGEMVDEAMRGRAESILGRASPA
ncbi:HpcH/HpaI aldolase/citrate lyase family protein [Herbiconiux solani]|uniref:HpcH/HpaI aldolase/citrate lyase family protein n=1 Tax=Herbiconiux solani TaxID=661329 RepID=UPI0008256804|nr:aldolase/citrate lyase family protein [Herbiconiux solani]